MGFSRQEHWSGFHCRPPGDVPDSRIEPTSPGSLALQADSLLLSHQGNPSWEALSPPIPSGKEWVTLRVLLPTGRSGDDSSCSGLSPGCGSSIAPGIQKMQR